MATSGSRRSPTRKKDIATNNLCDACKLDGRTMEGTFYCRDCKDYMCSQCEMHHRKVKATRYHKVIIIKQSPTQTSGASNKPNKIKQSNAENKLQNGLEHNRQSKNEATSAEEFTSSKNMSTPAEDFFPVKITQPSVSRKPKPKIGKAFLQAIVTPFTTVNIKHSSDENEPFVKGLAFLERGELLIADYNNKKLKLLESTLKTKSTLVCPGSPYDVALINDNEAVVTLTDKQKLLFVKIIFPFMKCERSVKLNNDCKGVDVADDHIYVACSVAEDKPEVIILDLTGHVQRVIDIQKIAGNVSTLSHITLNPEGTKLYLTGLNQLLCLSIDGDVVFQCSDPESGIVVDGEDSTLVCSCCTCRILVVRPDGTKEQTLLSARDGLYNPYAITYRPRDSVLVVGGYVNELIVFKIKKEVMAKKPI